MCIAAVHTQRISAYSSDNNAYQTTLTRMVRLPFQAGGKLHGPEVGCELRVRALERGGHDFSVDIPGKGSNGFKLMGLGATVYSFNVAPVPRALRSWDFSKPASLR